MTATKIFFGLSISFLLITIGACTTKPIIPPGGIPLTPPVQDPGQDNPCDPGTISFQHQVLPIMVSACAFSGCHDPATAEEGVILDNYEHVRKEVKPGNPDNSELYKSIIDPDPDEIMPPPPASPLTDTQIGIIRLWIEQGAKNTDCGTPCDSTAASFANTIYPLLQDYCIGCHSSARSDGNVNIESYDKVLPYVQNGSFLGSMRHDAIYPVMPPTGSKLSACRITQVEKWINEGAKNN